MPHILYQDQHLMLCCKPAGVPSQPDPTGIPDLLTEITATHPNAHLVHRLDTPTGGVMVYALTKTSATALSTLVQDHERFGKEYLAVLSSPPATPTGEWTDYLYHDRRANKAYVVAPSANPRKGSKLARLAYRTVSTAPDGHTLLLVRLYTGRTHQIRVQFASRGLPLVGDGKYGSREKCPFIGLWSYHMTFPHPVTNATVTATAIPDTDCLPWSYFADDMDIPSISDHP